MLILDEPALAGAGTQMMTTGVEGVAETAATLVPAVTLVPAGVDSVSPLAASGFAAYGAATQVVDAFAQQELVRLGASLLESVGIYSAADAAGAAIVE